MLTLLKLQENFVDGALKEAPEILPYIKTGGKITPAQRLQIYRNNTFFILIDNLKAAFPATAAPASEEFFYYAAQEFIKNHPPQNGDMNTYGSQLPTFLRQAGLVNNHPFLEDVAKLEWLRQESYMSADESDALLHPSVRLLASPWPIIKLWQLGKNLLSVEDIDMNSSENAVVFRRNNGIEMWSVDKNVFDFISAFADGKDLQLPAEFDPIPHLSNLKEAGIIQQKGLEHDSQQ